MRAAFLAFILAFSAAPVAAGQAAAGQMSVQRAGQRSAGQASGYVLSGLPLVRQSYNACGPASISQVLAYYGLGVSMAEVSKYTRANDKAYMSAQAIVNFAPLVGMEARLYSGGSINTVRAAIKNGLPLIALQSHITPEGQVIPHWRVIVGYDDARQYVYVMDPLLGYILLSYNDFNRVWADQRGQFAVLYPPKLGVTVKKVIG